MAVERSCSIRLILQLKNDQGKTSMDIRQKLWRLWLPCPRRHQLAAFRLDAVVWLKTSGGPKSSNSGDEMSAIHALVNSYIILALFELED